MRKIVDTSVLRSAVVVDYLRGSPRHEIIVPQLVLCECLQGDGIRNARRSLIAIAKFSKQVLVLKGDSHLHKLDPRSQGVQSRLIDERLTRGLRTNLLFNLTQTGIAAVQVNQMIAYDESQADTVISLYGKMAEVAKKQLIEDRASLSPNELRAMRTKRVLLPASLERIEQRVMRTAAYALQNVGRDVRRISPRDGMYAVPYRFALALEALSMDWSASGGLETRSEKDFANDLRDMSHVAYSTFFDGILTADRRLLRVAELVRILLELFMERYSQTAPAK